MPKLSKAEVNYGPGHAKGDHCGICLHFERKTKTCEIVAGQITAGMWCKKFARASRAQRKAR